MLVGAILALPITAGILLSYTFPRRRLSALIGPLVFLLVAYFLGIKHGLFTVSLQKTAFLELLWSQKDWFLANWPRYVTDGPLGVKIGLPATIWAYWLCIGVLVGTLLRQSKVDRLLWGSLLGLLSPDAPSSVSPTLATPPKGGHDQQKTTDNSTGKEKAAFGLLHTLFTRKEAHAYAVQEALRRARRGRLTWIGYWWRLSGIFRRLSPDFCYGLGFLRIFGQEPPHLVPGTHLYRGIDRVFGRFHTRLRDALPGTTSEPGTPVHGSTHPSDDRLPVHGNDTRSWDIGDHASYRVPDADAGTVYTWGDLGMVGSVELLVAPPKVGKTSLCTQLANAQRTGSPFLGWPTTQSGTVWLVEETPMLFDPKRRQASGLPGAPERVSDRTWRHRPSTEINKYRLHNTPSTLNPCPNRGQTPLPMNCGEKLAPHTPTTGKGSNWSARTGHRRVLWEALKGIFTLWNAFTGLTSKGQGSAPFQQPRQSPFSFPGVKHYRRLRAHNPSHSTEYPLPLPAPLLAILYGPLVDRGLSPLASHLAMACTVASVRSGLTGIPFHTIQVDSLFHWCPEAETDSNAAMAVMQLFKTVASLGFLVRVIVHADETTGTVKGPQNITRQCDFLLHLSPLPKSAKARNTSRRLLSPEGRFSHRPNPGPLPYFLADDGRLLPLSPGSPAGSPAAALHGLFHTNGKTSATGVLSSKNALVSPDAPREMTPAPGTDRHLSDNHAPGATERGQGDTERAGDVGVRSSNGKAQVAQRGGMQPIPHQTVSAPRARALRHRQALVSLCPAPDEAPRPAAEIVAAFQAAHGLQRDRVYALAKEAQQAGLVDSSPIGSTRRLQWRRTAKS